MIYLFLLITLIMPSLADATYLNPTVTAKERLPNGATQVTMIFTGNENEPVVRLQFTAGSGTTAQTIGEWVDDRLKELNELETISKLPDLQPNRVITPIERTAR